MGDFTNEGASLSFPMLATTRMACPGDVAGRVDRVLNEVSEYDLREDILSMISDDQLLATWLRDKND